MILNEIWPFNRSPLTYGYCYTDSYLISQVDKSMTINELAWGTRGDLHPFCKSLIANIQRSMNTPVKISTKGGYCGRKLHIRDKKISGVVIAQVQYEEPGDEGDVVIKSCGVIFKIDNSNETK